jgi:serine/threonine protein kinase
MSVKRECPSCRSVYAGDDKLFCPKDGTRLLESQQTKAAEDTFVGRVIAGRFVLERRLGKGGMGVVYLANHNVLKRLFAVKLLRRENVSNERALARFFREARVASSVDHPNIVSIYDYGQTDKGEPYLVMEYVEGTVLYQLVRESRSRNLHPAYSVHILVQVARALEHAHERGVVHRDIKPENILLTTWNGQPDWVKVLDFGVARIVGQPPLTRIGEEIIGTPEFLAPEMLASPDIAPSVDLYSLGIMLHDTVVGEPPFRGDVREVLQGHMNVVPQRLSQRRKDCKIPPELDELAAALLEKDPSKRPTAKETVVRLEHIQSLMPTRASVGSRADGADKTSEISGVQPQVFDGTHTMIIGPAQSRLDGAELQGASTMVLPAAAAGLSDLTGAQDPEKRAEIEALESEIDIASLRLHEQVEKLAGEVWAAGWPDRAVELRRHLTECQQAEEQRGLRLAMLQEQGKQQLERLDQQRQALRQRIISLSERLQLSEGLPEIERQQLVSSIEDSERSLLAVFQTAPTSPEPEMLALRRQLREIQNDARRSLGDLARLVVQAAPASQHHQAMCRGIEQLQQQIDAAKAMLTLLTRAR